MIVVFNFPQGIKNPDDRLNKNNPTSLSLVKKISETKVELPCIPHIAMTVNLNSFYNQYHLNDEEKALWKQIFEICDKHPLPIKNIVVCKDYLEIRLDVWFN